MTHYASRKSWPCPTQGPLQPISTACEVEVKNLPPGERARDDINAVDCPECKATYDMWVDMRRRGKRLREAGL